MRGSIFGQNCGNFFTNKMDCIKMHRYICPDVQNFHINQSLLCSNFLCLELFFLVQWSWFSFSERKEKNHSCQALLKISDVGRHMLHAHCKCLVKKQCIGVPISATGCHKAINYCKRHRDWAIHPRWDYSLHWTCTFHLLPDPPMRNPSGRGLLFCVWC